MGMLRCRREPTGGSYQPGANGRSTASHRAASRGTSVRHRGHLKPADLPRDFVRLPHAGHNGFDTFRTTDTAETTHSFSRFKVAGEALTAPIAMTRSPGSKLRTTDRNCFDGSYAVISIGPTRTTTWPPARTRGSEDTSPSKRTVR